MVVCGVFHCQIVEKRPQSTKIAPNNNRGMTYQTDEQHVRACPQAAFVRTPFCHTPLFFVIVHTYVHRQNFWPLVFILSYHLQWFKCAAVAAPTHPRHPLCHNEQPPPPPPPPPPPLPSMLPLPQRHPLPPPSPSSSPSHRCRRLCRHIFFPVF